MKRMRLPLLLLLLTPLFALPALASNWGEDWGTMIWGQILAVPAIGKLGLLVLVLGFAGLAARVTKRSRFAASLLVIGLVPSMYSPIAEAQTVSVPNTFADGSVADADAMNANFVAVSNGLNAALTTTSVGPLIQFTNGTTANADEVNANFSALVDGVNTALSNRATDCAGAGGTWSAGTSTCTPAAGPSQCVEGEACCCPSPHEAESADWDNLAGEARTPETCEASGHCQYAALGCGSGVCCPENGMVTEATCAAGHIPSDGTACVGVIENCGWYFPTQTSLTCGG